MKKLNREEMIDQLVREVDDWSIDAIYEYVKRVYRNELEEYTNKALREELKADIPI